jgi:hypothetical protein
MRDILLDCARLSVEIDFHLPSWYKWLYIAKCKRKTQLTHIVSGVPLRIISS